MVKVFGSCVLAFEYVKGCLFVHTLNTKHRNLGHGTDALNWLIGFSTYTGIPIVTRAAPNVTGFFEKHGFKFVDREMVREV